jgi:hypothetical protein
MLKRLALVALAGSLAFGLTGAFASGFDLHSALLGEATAQVSSCSATVRVSYVLDGTDPSLVAKVHLALPVTPQANNNACDGAQVDVALSNAGGAIIGHGVESSFSWQGYEDIAILTQPLPTAADIASVRVVFNGP